MFLSPFHGALTKTWVSLHELADVLQAISLVYSLLRDVYIRDMLVQRGLLEEV